jgi:hypothetical protein
MSVDDRISKIYSEMEEDIQKKIKSSQYNESVISNKLQSFQSKMTKIIETNCKAQFDWIRQNTDEIATAQGSQFRLRDPSKQEEGQKIFQDLTNCASKHDLGLKDKIDDARTTINSISQVFMKCSDECIIGIDTKQDSEVKSCLMGCFDTSLKQSEKIQEGLIRNIEDVSLKI